MKVFGVGFHKTGTTTLTTCLRYLGLEVCPEGVAYTARASVVAKQYAQCLQIASQYDAFADSPWCYRGVYRVLDAVFPDAKFILTVRGADEWCASLMEWTREKKAMYDLSYFNTLGHAVLPQFVVDIKVAYLMHNAEVRQHFATRPEKLLVLDWTRDGWQPLCDFLGKPTPNIPLPWMLKRNSEGQYVDEHDPFGTPEGEVQPDESGTQNVSQTHTGS